MLRKYFNLGYFVFSLNLIIYNYNMLSKIRLIAASVAAVSMICSSFFSVRTKWDGSFLIASCILSDVILGMNALEHAVAISKSLSSSHIQTAFSDSRRFPISVFVESSPCLLFKKCAARYAQLIWMKFWKWLIRRIVDKMKYENRLCLDHFIVKTLVNAPRHSTVSFQISPFFCQLTNFFSHLVQDKNQHILDSS